MKLVNTRKRFFKIDFCCRKGIFSHELHMYKVDKSSSLTPDLHLMCIALNRDIEISSSEVLTYGIFARVN